MAKKQTNSSEKEERKVKYHDAFKPNIEQKSDAVKSQQYVKKKLPEKIELTQEQVWDLKRPKYVLYDTKEKPSSDTRTSAQRNADYWDPIKGASERNKSKMDNGKHPIQGLAKTVGTSALIATGALELPALATWTGLGSRALVGGAQGLGYGMLGMGTGNPVDDFTYGAMGEVGIPLAGGLQKGVEVGVKSTTSLIKKGVESTGELLNKSVQNAYKINPWAFKPNPKAYYRMLGNSGLEDAISTGTLRANPSPSTENWMMQNTENAGKVWFNKGIPMNERIDKTLYYGYKGPDFVEYTGELIETPVKRRIYGYSEKPIPLDNNSKFYREHWLKGYKEIKVPKKQGENMKYTSQFKLGGSAKILQTGGTSPNPWFKERGQKNNNK